jgi:hypothetical protein
MRAAWILEHFDLILPINTYLFFDKFIKATVRKRVTGKKYFSLLFIIAAFELSLKSE